MKIQILWADPRENRFRSGDILGDDEIAQLGLDVSQMLELNEIQILDREPARARRTRKAKEG